MKLTKNELREQQIRLSQFEKYLPTLQLKKAMLQVEVNMAVLEIQALRQDFHIEWKKVSEFAPFLLEEVEVDLEAYASVSHVKKRYENIAGVEIPEFESVVFKDPGYFLFDTPVWTDMALEAFRFMVTIKEKIHVAEEKKRALEKELKDVSIRVNLFEKVLIPRSMENIKKIKVFLGDQFLSSVAQAKVAKKKILLKAKMR